MALQNHSILIVALVGAGSFAGVQAQMDHSAHTMGAAKPASTAADAAMGDAVVKKIDKAGKKVTLAHGALPNGMPAMTMAYRVKDAAMLDAMKEGQKIRFATDPADGMTVLRFEPAK
jgi:Cu/Ag efflux protein CusF